MRRGNRRIGACSLHPLCSTKHIPPTPPGKFCSKATRVISCLLRRSHPKNCTFSGTFCRQMILHARIIDGASIPCPSLILVHALRTENGVLSHSQPSHSPYIGLFCASDCYMCRSSMTFWSDTVSSRITCNVLSQHSPSMALGFLVSAERRGNTFLENTSRCPGIQLLSELQAIS